MSESTDLKSNPKQLKSSGSAVLAASLLVTNMVTITQVEAKVISKPSIAMRQAATAGGTRSSHKNIQAKRNRGSGTMIAMTRNGEELGQCPLKHTDVSAEISGYISKVKVTQIFENTFSEPVEAVYTFPLSDTGAVDEMEMKVGSQIIHGSIKKRAEAKQIYDEDKSRGQVASLLDQERTNIFTQSVANIPPGEKVEVTLHYVETLPFENGKFSFVFPTVVGPRFNPGAPVGRVGGGRDLDTNEVPDASRITPPVTPAGTRAGHDISIAVSINAGLPVDGFASKLHQIVVESKSPDRAIVSLKDQETIPNKDFVLTWNVAGEAFKSGCLTHKLASEKSGYFTLMLIPPRRVQVSEVAPKEMIFLVDCSGSQFGKPLDKAKETLSYIVEHMNPQDTLQVIAFNNGYDTLFDKPRAVNEETKRKARSYIQALAANGGTWMAPAVEAACAVPPDGHRLRVVTFMTDGFVGNDMEILGLIKKLRGSSRWFSFGTGNSVNRALIDGIAQEGGGEADYVLLNSSAAEAGKKFYDRISTPVLTDVKLDFGSLAVKEVFPNEVSDVWAERPLYFKGRYQKPGKGVVTLSGFSAGKPYKQTLDVDFPARSEANAAVTSVWARAKVDRLMQEDYSGAQNGNMKKELKDEIVATALQNHIMTQFTSFVAVADLPPGKPSGKTIVVPVDMTDGVSREATVGGGASAGMLQGFRSAVPHPSASSVGRSMYKSSGYSVGHAQSSHRRADMAALPPPSALPPPPLPGGTGGGAGSLGSSAGWVGATPVVASPKLNSPASSNSGSPAQLQCNEEGAPIIRDHREPYSEKKKVVDKSANLYAGERGKLSSTLLASVTSAINNHDSKTRVTVSITFKGSTPVTKFQLAKLGLKNAIVGIKSNIVTGDIRLVDLIAVLKLKDVAQISLVKNAENKEAAKL